MAINNRYARKVKRTKLYAKLGDIFSCEDLPDTDHCTLLTDNVLINDVMRDLGDHFAVVECDNETPSAIMIYQSGRGDYDDLYVCFDRRPFDLDADYYRVIRNW